MKYVILIMNTPGGSLLTDEQRDAWMTDVMAWYDKLRGEKVVEAGHQLDTAAKAKTVRSGGVFDGPFMETKEVLGGYSVLEADTIDDAVEMAKTWPGVDRGWITIEVRPVVEN